MTSNSLAVASPYRLLETGNRIQLAFELALPQNPKNWAKHFQEIDCSEFHSYRPEFTQTQLFAMMPQQIDGVAGMGFRLAAYFNKHSQDALAMAHELGGEGLKTGLQQVIAYTATLNQFAHDFLNDPEAKGMIERALELGVLSDKYRLAPIRYDDQGRTQQDPRINIIHQQLASRADTVLTGVRRCGNMIVAAKSAPDQP